MLTIAAILPAHASDSHDHDRARQALQAGEIMPLKAILERVERDTPGQVIDVELERGAGRWIYEIKVLAAGGSIVELEIDARDGSILKRKGGHRARGRER
ncbi:MAG: PepSY domain-containing protein [Burkholderiales bacterium]|nr:PepSY domain-containing protein [Burkholderiales bacterium]